MGWESVSLKDISPNTEILPEKDFTFALKSAKYDNYGKISLAVIVADDSEFKGQKTYISYPNPDDQPWVLHTLKRLEIALGVDQEDGEDIVVWLNRAANLGAKFAGPIKHRTYTPQGSDEKKTKAEFAIGAVRAAA